MIQWDYNGIYAGVNPGVLLALNIELLVYPRVPGTFYIWGKYWWTLVCSYIRTLVCSYIRELLMVCQRWIYPRDVLNTSCSSSYLCHECMINPIDRSNRLCMTTWVCLKLGTPYSDALLLSSHSNCYFWVSSIFRQTYTNVLHGDHFNVTRSDWPWFRSKGGKATIPLRELSPKSGNRFSKCNVLILKRS